MSQELVIGPRGSSRFRLIRVGNTVLWVMVYSSIRKHVKLLFCVVSGLAVQFLDPVIYWGCGVMKF